MTRAYPVICMLVLFLTLPGPAFAGIEHKIVQTTGTGLTLRDAINDALTEAIGRVNGKSMDVVSQLDRAEATTDANNDATYYFSDMYQQSIATATKGVVSSYDVINQNQEASGRWQVTLSAKIAKFKQVKRSNRKRIAVMPLRVSTREFLIENSPIDKNNTNRILNQNLVSHLVQSRRFTVLDREYIRETLGERSLLVDGNTPVEQMARLGHDLVADYILAGTLEDVAFTTNNVRMQTSDRVITTRSGKVELSYRIIDVDTKQVVFSEFSRLKFTESDIRNADPSIGNENMQSVLSTLAAERIGKKILNAIYPILVVSVTGDTVTLGQGGSGLKCGDRFDVFEFGERMIDPYTKESIGREELFIATIEVTRVSPRQSYATIVTSERDMSATFMPKKFVCRIPQEGLNTKSERKTKTGKERAKRRKDFDDDW